MYQLLQKNIIPSLLLSKESKLEGLARVKILEKISNSWDAVEDWTLDFPVYFICRRFAD